MDTLEQGASVKYMKSITFYIDGWIYGMHTIYVDHDDNEHKL